MPKRNMPKQEASASSRGISRALRAADEPLRVIFENIEDVVYLIEVEPDGYRFAAVNPSFLAATGLAMDQVVGQRVEAVIPESSLGLVLQHYAEAVASGRPVHWEESTSYPAGTRHGEVMIAPVTDGQGRVVQLVGTVHDVTERHEIEEALNRLAHFDALTGLPNRRHLYACLEKAIASQAGQRADDMLALLYLDLDRFKYVNDTLGHAMGDQLLREMAERILGCVRNRDTVGRLGGDEFAIIARVRSHPDDAAGIARLLLQGMQVPFNLDDHQVVVTPSIGIAVCPVDATDSETLVQLADTAMYHAKLAGRNAYRFYTQGMNTQVRARRELELALASALVRDEFVLHYQPQMDLTTRRCIGAEALLRWQRPGEGLVMPNDFMRVLEDSGLIEPVGNWVLSSVCRQLAQWQADGVGPFRVAVNLSARQVAPEYSHDFDGILLTEQAMLGRTGAGLVEHVECCLQEHGIDGGLLELELTESTLMSDVQRTIGLLTRLKALGLRVAVDDFGTGYSSLAYLKRFPIDTLKIDRGFVRDLPADADDVAITRAIIGLAHSLNLQVIAEGVETTAQLEFLRGEGCNLAQGYYFSRPVPPETFLAGIGRFARAGDPTMTAGPQT